MAIPISHDWQKGIWRLTHCMADVAPADHLAIAPIDRHRATAEHRALFEEYKGFIEAAVEIAGDWWQGRIEVKTDAGLSATDALEACYQESLAGPAARGEVVWTVRKFWLDCIDLNRATPTDRRVRPEQFLLEWLLAEGHDEEAAILAGMPYWPIGMDADGEWV